MDTHGIRMRFYADDSLNIPQELLDDITREDYNGGNFDIVLYRS